MKQCKQTDTQTVYEHGLSVWNYTQKIIRKEWEYIKVPKWLEDNYQYIIDNVCDLNDIKEYNIYHDCGKPFCLEIDSEGRRHFPDHAKISQHTWDSFSDNKTVSQLISLDMMMHTETADEIHNRKLPKDILLTLLITSLAEVHSNAQMFGGIDSTSFKIKYKKLVKRGNMIFRRCI